MWPHEVEPWFYSWYRGRVETLDSRYNLAYINSTLCGHTKRKLVSTLPLYQDGSTSCGHRESHLNIRNNLTLTSHNDNILVCLFQVGKGLLRVLRGNKHGIADLVPVDMLNNIIISAGWMTGINPQEKPIIYQYTSGTVNPITWLELCT